MGKSRKKVDLRIKIFALVTILLLIVLLVAAFILDKTEFIYYDFLLLPLLISIYFLHKRLRMNTVIFSLVCLIFLMHATGGILNIGGTRLYDLTFSFIKFDMVIHFLSSFLVVFILYNLIFDYVIERKKVHGVYLFFILVLMAAGAGTLIELIELIGVILFDAGEGVGDYFNNAIDLLSNLIGAVVAALIIVWYHKKKAFKELVRP